MFCALRELWFDVEIERITTRQAHQVLHEQLWFDVEIERITTILTERRTGRGCGLM